VISRLDLLLAVVSLGLLNVALLGMVHRGIQDSRRAVRRIDSTVVWQHRRRTPVATIAGLIDALERGLETGGLQAAQRRAIYDAIDEQFAEFYRLDEEEPPASGSPLSRTSRLWRFRRPAVRRRRRTDLRTLRSG
jgi:hypothetical protein